MESGRTIRWFSRYVTFCRFWGHCEYPLLLRWLPATISAEEMLWIMFHRMSHMSHSIHIKRLDSIHIKKYICIWGRTSSGNESFEDFADVVASLAQCIIVHRAWWCESSREHCVSWSAIFSICLRLVALSWLSPSGDISSSLLDYVQDDSWSGPSYVLG